MKNLLKTRVPPECWDYQFNFVTQFYDTLSIYHKRESPITEPDCFPITWSLNTNDEELIPSGSTESPRKSGKETFPQPLPIKATSRNAMACNYSHKSEQLSHGFLFFKLGYRCFTTLFLLLLYSKVNQPHIYIYSLSRISFPFRSLQCIEWSSHLLSMLQKEQTCAICRDVDGSRECYMEWSKSETLRLLNHRMAFWGLLSCCWEWSARNRHQCELYNLKSHLQCLKSCLNTQHPSQTPKKCLLFVGWFLMTPKERTEEGGRQRQKDPNIWHNVYGLS